MIHRLSLTVNNRVKTAIRPAVVKSRATMMFRRFIRSAMMPPTGESRTVGIMETARMVPKAAAEPVRSSTYMDRAKRRMALPNREMIWPMIIRLKFRWNSFFGFIAGSFRGDGRGRSAVSRLSFHLYTTDRYVKKHTQLARQRQWAKS